MKYTLWQQKVGAPWRAHYVKDNFTFDDYEPTYIDKDLLAAEPGDDAYAPILRTFNMFIKKKYFPKDFNGRELKMGDLIYLADGQVYYWEALGLSYVDKEKITKSKNGD